MNAICTTCGTQYGDTRQPPAHCPICEDERQYIGLSGQSWTTLDKLRRDYKTELVEEEDGLTSFVMQPHFGIGQRAFLLETGAGNILWDCISLLDEPSIKHIKGRGGVSCICISHPHYYTTIVEWSRAFGDVPIYLHGDDAQWVMRPADCIQHWDGEMKRLPGDVMAVRCGGHFKGATVLHWAAGAGGRGALLTGDTIQVVPDRRFVSFMWSYPNLVPLDATAVKRIVAAVEPYAFERIYGAFPKMTVSADGKDSVRRSAERYTRATGGVIPTSPSI